MKFAVVGETPATLSVVAALHNSHQHSVTHAALLSDDSVVLSQLTGIRRVAEWEDLLADETIDAAIISGNEDEILPPARLIASTSRPLVVVPSRGLTSAFAYELSLVRDENLVPLYPVLLHRLDPAGIKLREMIESGEVGSVVQFKLERTITTSDNLLTQSRDVEPFLLPDADMLRWMGGAFTQVTALYQGSTDNGFANATVNLAGDSATDSSWVLSTGPSPHWKLTVFASNGQFVLEHEDEVSRLTKNGEPIQLTDGAMESHRDTWLSRLPDAVNTFIAENALNNQASVWTDFTRSHEIVDAHRRSIKRRRTIDMHFETLSERSQFKTQMAAMGCGVLTYTLFGLVAYLVVAGAFDPGDEPTASQLTSYQWLCRIAFWLWIGPLLIFLAAQFLLTITKPSAQPTLAEPDE